MIVFYRKVILSLYVFSNIYFSIYYGVVGYLGGDFSYQYKIVNYEFLILSFFLATTPFLFFHCIYVYLVSVKSNKKASYYDSVYLRLLFLIISIMYFLFLFYYGVGVSGVSIDKEAIPKFVFYFFSIFQPNLLLMIYFFYCKGFGVINTISLFLFVLSIFLSAKTIGLLFLFSLFVIRWGSKNKFRQLTVLILVVAGLIVYPILRVLKLAMMYKIKASSSSYVDAVYNYVTDIKGGWWSSYIDSFGASLERLAVISNVQYIIENANVLSEYLSKTHYMPIYIDFWLFRIFSEAVNIPSNVSLQSLMAYEINGLTDWSAQTSLFSLFFLSITEGTGALFVSVLLIFILARLSKLFIDGYIVELSWLVGIVFLCHGWFGGVYNYIQSLLLFFLIIITLRFTNEKG